MNEIIKNKIWTFDNFFSKEECQKFIEQIDNKKNKICFTNSGKFENDKYVDLELANYFFNKICKLVNIEILKPNNLIMTGKYFPGESFNLHTDTGLYFDLQNNEKSRYTLLIYLNDNYQKGDTIFYTDEFKELAKVIPKQGSALLFDIDLWHRGNIVEAGNKYWIGCEIIAKM